MKGISVADLYKFDEIYWVPQDKSEAQLAESPAVEVVADTIAEVKPKVSTPWVVVGQIAEAELSRLKLIFSAPPLVLGPADWSVYTPSDEEPSFTEFLKETSAKRYIFIGQQPAVWQGELPTTEIDTIESKLVYFFPRYISSLTDAEKTLKMAFWNALKEMKG
ncbi:hypothetical protein [Aquirufa antheringensis]|uniref:hypothetical protein n=1 Tax=Aquirufa antheringensis TaxID=2516559 RepID=UPI0022A8106B|nr:hypothetical protein [Aquirufa antheringensis]MCZ2487795.1 hypothetical protein [Aquirufa antheringensis]MCZ2489380.1 hypothetical protein [Aquirufa antheringensis]